MMRSRLAELELRLQKIEELFGSLEPGKQQEMQEAKEKIQSMISKSHK